MLTSFISIEFAVFFTAVLAVFYVISDRFRVAYLFYASMLFVGLISPTFLFYGIIFTSYNYFAGRIIGNKDGDGIFRRRVYLLSQSLNIGLLVFFKYVVVILEYLLPTCMVWKSHYLILPLGISYYSFQSISYLYLIFKGVEKPEYSFVRFGLYQLFFPKFIAGPIERSRSFLPQISGKLSLTSDNYLPGIRLFMWGAFKKIVVANTLGIIVNKVYDNPAGFTTIPIIIALIVQSSYIYTDFSGYTDMALGLGRMFGIRLSPNFNKPFSSQTIGEFWRRWHISLSSWCNDFIYNRIMLKYRRKGKVAALYGITATFLIIGVWHGANFTFIILGLLQALAITYEFFSKSFRYKVSQRVNGTFYRIFSVAWVNIFFTFSLIFFFAPSVEHGFDMLYQLSDFTLVFDSGIGFNLSRVEFLFALLCLVFVYAVEFEVYDSFFHKIFYKNMVVRQITYLVWLFMIVYFSKNQIVFTYAGF